jgi:hypothetical protein
MSYNNNSGGMNYDNNAYPQLPISMPSAPPVSAYNSNYSFNNNNNNNINNGMPPPPSYQDSTQQSYGVNNNADYNSNQNGLTMEQKLQNVVRRHEIGQFFAQKMMSLKAFKIVFVFDDSGSMCSVLNDSPLNTSTFRATRWDELQYFANISIEVANVFTNEGCDVFFLNRAPIKCVRNIEQLRPSFLQKPAGFTPLTGVLNTILYENSRTERQLLIIIVTDGEPTDDSGRRDIHSFKRCLQHRPRNVFTTIVACTDEDDSMEYLNNWDRTIPRLDIVDDYRSEKNEVKRTQKHGSSFSFGDYVAKSLIGSIDQQLDRMDERRVTSSCTLL